MRYLALILPLAVLTAEANAQDAPSPPATADPFALTATLDQNALSAQTIGNAAIANSIQQLTATNSGNSVNADAVTTGDVVIGADALQGFSGIGNFVMNTGNNNNLQGSVSVVVMMTPP